MPNYLLGNPTIAVSRPDKRLNKFVQGGVINSFSMPKELTSIAPYAFVNIGGLTEVIFTNQDDVVNVSSNSGIGANVKFVVPEQLYDAYVAKYPNRTIVSYETGYEWTVPYVEGETSTTLTAAYLNACIAANPDAKKAQKVVVPSYFTSYASGSINAIISAFENMEVLTTTYSGGIIDLDMNGDIMAKITEIGKTVEEALLYAKTIEQTYDSSSNVNMRSNSQLVLFPPISVNKFVVQNGQGSFYGCANLVAVMNPISSVAQDYGICRYCDNLVSFEFRCNATSDGGSWTMAFEGCSSLKRVTIDYENQITLSEDVGFGLNKSLDKLIYANLANNFCVYYINQAARPELSKDVMVSFFQSLGTPATTKTIYLGSTNLAKLTAEDIAIATAKNWALQ